MNATTILRRSALHLVIIAGICSSVSVATAQELERRTLPNGDTLVKRIVPSVWRYGAAAAVQAGIDAGSTTLQFPFDAASQQTMEAKPVLSSGWLAGAFVEWLPVGSRLGAALNVAFEARYGAFGGTAPQNALNYNRVEIQTALQYCTISPAARFALGADKRWWLRAGMDAELLMNAALTPRYIIGTATDQTSERFAETPALSALQVNSFRVGGHLGIEWDVPIVHTISATTKTVSKTQTPLQSSPQSSLQTAQVVMSPYLSVHAGMPIANREGFSWNTVLVRAGVAVKIGERRVEELRLPARPLLAKSGGSRANGSGTPSGGAAQPNQPSDDPQAAKPKESRETSDIDVVAGSASNAFVILPNEPFALPYSAQQDTALTDDMKRYLLAAVNYLKTRKQAMVRVIGHTEAVGSAAEKRRVSESRAAEAARYLLSKGIERKRIAESGMSDRQPAGDNRTEVGRKENRRLEVVIVE